MNLATQVPKTFAFDTVYPPDCRQRQIYDETAFPLVESVLEGYNGTIFAYGQTGCGKTFTMTGVPDNEELRGIIPNSFAHIFSAIEEIGAAKTFLVRCSFIEIYNEELRDLLNIKEKKKLDLKENKDQGIYIRGLTQHAVKNISEIDRLMTSGSSHRITQATNMNERSSRSHALFVIYIEQSEMSEGRQIIKAGKLNLVDLAGSERQKKTDAQGDRLKEAIEINLSLSALGNVISALVDGNVKHVPYRDSKLTRLLQDSLGGNTKTVMIAVASPASDNYDESLSTLRYASRAKFIQNKPTVNEDPKDALLRSYVEEINRLKRLLEERSSGEPMIIEKIIEKIVEKPVDRIVERERSHKGKKARSRKKGKALESIESDEEEDSPRNGSKRDLSDSGSSREFTATSIQSIERKGSGARAKGPVKPKQQPSIGLEDDSDVAEDSSRSQPKKAKKPARQPSTLLDDSDYSEEDEKSPGKKIKGPGHQADEADYSDDFESENVSRSTKSPAKQGLQKLPTKNQQSSKRLPREQESHKVREVDAAKGAAKKRVQKASVAKKQDEEDEYSEDYESEPEQGRRAGKAKDDEDDYSDDFETEAKGVKSQPPRRPANAPTTKAGPSKIEKQPQITPKQSSVPGTTAVKPAPDARPTQTKQLQQAAQSNGPSSSVSASNAKAAAAKAARPLDDDSSQEEAYSSFEAEQPAPSKPSAKGKRVNKKSIIPPKAGAAKPQGSKPQKKANELGSEPSDSAAESVDERARLENFVTEIHNQLISGGKVLEQADKDRLLAQRNFQKQLKEQRKRENEVMEATRRREEDMLMNEKQYQNQTEELQDQRRVISKLRLKYKAALGEIEDLNKEQARQREDIFDSVRNLEHEIDFLHKVLEYVIAPGELQLIKSKSKFKDEDNTWSVPPFVLQQRQTAFPKISKAQGKEMAMNEIKNRQLVFSHRIGPNEDYKGDYDDRLRDAKFNDFGQGRDAIQAARSVEPTNFDRPKSSRDGSLNLNSRSKRVILNPIESAPAGRKYDVNTNSQKELKMSPMPKKTTQLQPLR
eukprot:CAMPEP_0204914734 /NCGR_PEP_ID=MMETSP1397-20131031/12636_1 /ASSEMBLY_ACC=CAM_ASM_000891 /TAXON_ID=49980 /ORGANISM="Climacostomum Climacostomum virens, Strain Stock W-24" /LENGTH=1044 /DNA_ID=CAMNT_0052086443 /DNA_START=99 /DNA_END=3233 /DNA_ORIENTATION=-